MRGATVTGMCPRCFQTQTLQVEQAISQLGEIPVPYRRAVCGTCKYGEKDSALLTYVDSLSTHAPVDLVMVGDTTTGKTSLIVALVYLMRSKAKRSREEKWGDGWAETFAEDLHQGGLGDESSPLSDFGDEPDGDGYVPSREKLAGNLDRFIERFNVGEFPSGTATGLQPPLIVRITTPDGRPMRNCQVIFRDVPGEAFDSDVAIRRDAPYLKRAQNVVCLISLPTLSGRSGAEGRRSPRT